MSFNNSLSYKGNLCSSNVAQWNEFYNINSSNTLLPNDQILHLLNRTKSDLDLAENIEKILIKKLYNLENREPKLILRVEGIENEFQLVTQDLKTLFNVFNNLKSVKLIKNNEAIIEYHLLLNAFLARQQLNGK